MNDRGNLSDTLSALKKDMQKLRAEAQADKNELFAAMKKLKNEMKHLRRKLGMGEG